MSVKIPKISLGVGNRSKSKLNFSNTSSGSTTWGHMLVPYSCYLDAGDTIHYKDGNFTRLFPLVAPTFSRSVKMRFFAQFVPDADLLENYENMMTGTVYAPGAGNPSYIPKNTLVATLSFLTEYVLSESYFSIYSGSPQVVSGFTNVQRLTNISSIESIFKSQFHYFEPDTLNLHRTTDISPDNYDFVLHFANGANHYFAFFKFSAKVHRFVSILNQLGYQLDFHDEEYLSVLPLFSYYKAWFDSNFVQRRMSWTQTIIFEFLHNHCVEGSSLQMNLTFMQPQDVKPIFDLISNCYYSYDPDYFSMQLDNASLEPIGSSISSFGALVGSGVPTSQNGAGVGINGLPSVSSYNGQTGSPYNVNRWQLQLVNALTKFIDKRSVVGQNVQNLLAAHGYGDAANFRDSYVLGSWDFDLQVSDVTATAAGSGSMGDSFLGEYTGKSQGQGGSPSIKFTADKPGMFLILMCVVPDLEYVTGVQPYLYSIDKFSKYNTEFDSLGRVSTRKSEFLTNRDYCSGSGVTDFVPDIDTDAAFGIVPRYAGLKVKPSTISGLLYNHSSRDQFAPYTLSRLIAPTSVRYDSSAKTLSFDKVIPGNIVASDELRYCGKHEWLGNFNRIFVDGFVTAQDVTDPFKMVLANDHFIFHALNDVSLYSVKKSLGQSFDTDAGGYNIDVVQQ